MLAAVEHTIKKWIGDGLCVPQEILLLHARSQLQESELGNIDSIADYPLLQPFGKGEGIQVSSIHKAKGLDAKAVIVVGVPQLTEDDGQEYDRYSLFMGASRARQLLAVFTVRGG